MKAYPVFANELNADTIDSAESVLWRPVGSSTGSGGSKRLSRIWTSLKNILKVFNNS